MLLFQLNISVAPGAFRLAAYDQDLFFHGEVFTRYPLEAEQLETPTHTALTQVRVTVGNVTQEFQALLENYWVFDRSPQWEVLIWEVDATQPDQTPFGFCDVFSVQQVTTDLLTAVVELTAEGLTLGATVPKRRWNSSNGFNYIPARN